MWRHSRTCSESRARPRFGAFTAGAFTWLSADHYLDEIFAYYSRISLALDPQARTRVDALFEKAEGTRQTPWDTVKNEPGQPTVKGVKRFLENAKWLKEQTVDLTVLAGIPVVKLQRFAAEARGLNASRMKEAQPDKRYAFAVALIQRQRARALDDAADMLIRLVQRMHNTAKEKLLLLQSARLQQSGELVAKLRDVSLAVTLHIICRGILALAFKHDKIHYRV